MSSKRGLAMIHLFGINKGNPSYRLRRSFSFICHTLFTAVEPTISNYPWNLCYAITHPHPKFNGWLVRHGWVITFHTNQHMRLLDYARIAVFVFMLAGCRTQSINSVSTGRNIKQHICCLIDSFNLHQMGAAVTILIFGGGAHFV